MQGVQLIKPRKSAAAGDCGGGSGGGRLSKIMNRSSGACPGVLKTTGFLSSCRSHTFSARHVPEVMQQAIKIEAHPFLI